MDTELAQTKEELGATQKQLDLAKEKLNKPFEKGEMLKDMTKELNSINLQLDIGKENIGAIVEEVEGNHHCNSGDGHGKILKYGTRKRTVELLGSFLFLRFANGR